MRRFIVSALFAVCITKAAIAGDASGLVKAAAKKYGVPITVALKVAKVESGVRCGRVGRAGERGPLQILPRSASMLGYRRISRANCAVQTDAGMKHLARCWFGSRGNKRLAIACHNQGFGILKTKRISRAGARYVRMVMR